MIRTRDTTKREAGSSSDLFGKSLSQINKFDETRDRTLLPIAYINAKGAMNTGVDVSELLARFQEYGIDTQWFEIEPQNSMSAHVDKINLLTWGLIDYLLHPDNRRKKLEIARLCNELNQNTLLASNLRMITNNVSATLSSKDFEKKGMSYQELRSLTKNLIEIANAPLLRSPKVLQAITGRQL